MYKRIINLDTVLNRKSVFLFGPRQTGKSTWIRNQFHKALYINLLEKKVYDDYANKPNALRSDIELHLRKKNLPIIIIDEVQKLPQLLDEVHNEIENNKDYRFILTGSSSRKLKRSGANLLGGRASWREMFPLVYPEIKSKLITLQDLETRLLVGGLPSIFDSTAPFEDLDDYIKLYLNEEIKSEGFVRNFEGFNRFLTTAALSNGKQINFTEIANDAQIPPRTAHDHFQILEDTLIGFMLNPFKETPSRKAVSTAKFYLFDTGLVNGLLRREKLVSGTPEFGELFEQFIVCEIRAYISYFGVKSEMYFWRSTSKLEVDVIIKDREKIWAIEIKAKANLSNKDLRGLKAFCEDYPKAKRIVVTLEGRHAIDAEKNEIIPCFNFLDMLWKKELF